MPNGFSKYWCILIILLASSAARSQDLNRDLVLLSQHSIESITNHEHHHHRPGFLMADHHSAFVRYNPATLLFGSLMYVYQTLITQQLSSTCLYSPTCSAYSKGLIQEFGLFSGIIFTADRLTRCNRLALYDYPKEEIDHQLQKIHQDLEHYKIRKN